MWDARAEERHDVGDSENEKRRLSCCAVALALLHCAWAAWSLREVVGGLARQVVGVITASGHWSACLLCAQ